MEAFKKSANKFIRKRKNNPEGIEEESESEED